MAVNQFIVMRNRIRKFVDVYKRVFAECNITDKWHSGTIMRMANPFLNGHFTLAVVGKMSSGKSTFINTLIGADILPTGDSQTTSAITFIENGPKPSLKVTFADGSVKNFTGDNIKSELRKIAAVPEEFSLLPINDINILISGGDTIEDILDKKEGIEEKTKSPCLPNEMWIKYVSSHPKSTIAQQINIEYPLGDDLLGWRIVDTPGVGAIGGIQDETKRLLNQRDEMGGKMVDAIIFLQRGDDNLEDSTNVEFIENTFKELTREAQQRLFFVLTHSTAPKFRRFKHERLKMADELYGVRYNIPAERLTYVDSLLARFHADVIGKNIDLQAIDPDDAGPLPGWTQNECDDVYELFSPMKKELKNRGLSINNSNLRSIMAEWGHFDALKDIINSFVADVKQSAYKSIVELIITDYQNIIKEYDKEIVLLNSGEEAIKHEQEELLRKRKEYNIILSKLRRSAQFSKISKRFAFVEDELSQLSQKKTIALVRTSYMDIMDRALALQKEIFDELANDFKSFCSEFSSDDIVLSKIDFQQLETEAKSKHTTYETDYDYSEEEDYTTGTFSPTHHTRTIYPRKKQVTNWEETRREFTALVLKKGRSIRDKFMSDLEAKTIKLCDIVEADISAKVEALENRLKDLLSKLADKDEEIKKLNGYKSIVETALTTQKNDN